MKRSWFCLLLLTAAAVTGGSFHLESPVVLAGSDEILSYDDGSGSWLTWGGLYRGVWFDVADFDPAATGCEVNSTAYWFYHHASYPWDTASFYAELWNGDASGPTVQLDQTSMMAVHYAPVYATYSPTLGAASDFWALVNTSLSSGGWPSLLGDNTPHVPSHSFYSDDFILWEPWIVTGTTASDYLIRVSATLDALEGTTWGSMKGLFR